MYGRSFNKLTSANWIHQYFHHSWILAARVFSHQWLYLEVQDVLDHLYFYDFRHLFCFLRRWKLYILQRYLNGTWAKIRCHPYLLVLNYSFDKPNYHLSGTIKPLTDKSFGCWTRYGEKDSHSGCPFWDFSSFKNSFDP